MTDTCAGCGASVDFESRPAEVRRATCPACGQGTEVIRLLVAGAAPAEGVSGAVPGEVTPPPKFTISCPECEGSMTLRIASPDLLEGKCASCSAIAAFARRMDGEEEESEEEPEEAAPARPRAWAPRPPSRGFPSDRPPTRPCRECGGELRFST
ncbi:MAG: hypothetical protein ACREC5_04450, partial [Thermoplasmata archaeon]